MDDHAGMRDGIGAMLSVEPDMEMAGEASNGQEAMDQFRTLQPDISLVDWNLPVLSGEAVIARLSKEFPQARFIVITALNEDDCVWRAISLGSHAFLHKHMLRSELVPTIRAVHEGRRYFPVRTLNRFKLED